MKISITTRIILIAVIFNFVLIYNLILHFNTLQLKSENTKHSDIQYFTTISVLDSIIFNLKEIQIAEKNLIFQHSKEQRIEDIYFLVKQMKQTNRQIHTINDAISNSTNDSVLQLTKYFDDYELILKKIDFQINQNNFENANTLSNQLSQTYINRLLVETGAIKETYNQQYQQINANFEKQISSNFRIIMILFVISLLLISALFITIIIDFRRSNKKIIHALQFISDGNFAEPIVNISRNEFRKIELFINEMAKNISERIFSLTDGVQNISNASSEIANTAYQLSEGASEQASSSEVITASMEEMVSSILQNSENAQNADRISQKISVDVKETQNAVSLTLKAMQDIATKISVINHIAGRTDLLAINAGVEAARAGEYGKGFGYVASEIRKLAENSGKAAIEIEQLIKKSVVIAENSNQLLTSFVPSIENVLKLVQEIAASSIEQNSNSNQINTAMVQLNEVTQQNACSSEQLASSVSEFSSQAEQLLEAINYFKKNKNTLSANNSNKKNGNTSTELFQTVKTKNPIKIEHSQGVYINLNEIDNTNYEPFSNN